MKNVKPYEQSLLYLKALEKKKKKTSEEYFIPITIGMISFIFFMFFFFSEPKE